VLERLKDTYDVETPGQVLGVLDCVFDVSLDTAGTKAGDCIGIVIHTDYPDPVIRCSHQA
jgi:hypothetical protein